MDGDGHCYRRAAGDSGKVLLLVEDQGHGFGSARQPDGQFVTEPEGRVFVDSMDTAVQKSGDLLLAVAEEVMGLDDVRAGLGDVIAGRHAGRRNEDEVILFDSVGVGMQDLAIGRLMYDVALARNLGLSLDLGM